MGKTLRAFKTFSLLFGAIFVCFNTISPSMGAHGVAMRGEPKYKKDFLSFDYVNPKAPKGGRINLATVGTFDSLNPFVPTGHAAAGLGFGEGLYFEPLCRRSSDEPFTVYGHIAKSIELAPDRSWIEFSLNPDARWHDGTPITADDVIASAEFLRDKGRANLRLFYSKITSVDRKDNLTVRFNFDPKTENQDPELPMLISLMTVLPKSVKSDPEFEGVTLKAIMGSGPYTISSFEPGRFIEYARKKDYWGEKLSTSIGSYNFDIVHYDYYRDRQVLMEAFKAGVFDMIEEGDPMLWATSYDFPAIRDGRAKKLEVARDRPSGLTGFVFNTRREVFKSRNVRRALSIVFDFDWLNKNLFNGSFARTTSYYQGSSLAASGRIMGAELNLLQPFRNELPSEIFTSVSAFDQERGASQPRDIMRMALKYLEEAGWTLKNGKIHNSMTQTPLSFEIMILDDKQEKLANAYARNLRQLGVEARLRRVDPSQYESRRLNYDYDMIIVTWGQSHSPGNEQKYYWSSQAADSPGTRNYAGIKSPAVDFLCEKIASAVTQKDLETATRALDRVLIQGYYSVPLYHLAKDYLAIWDKFGIPPVDPKVGTSVMRWWSKEAHTK